ncbi:hypothetical protein RRG08_024870 [Elysia crispata]|uniref:Uncharacterized protein n=1 Tax=Elysia crispata TaxID=231223 RepID=A0AAE1D0D4_9GAST|nr:hypothetical protein RRG08_024870 [Elysia crispata]
MYKESACTDLPLCEQLTQQVGEPAARNSSTRPLDKLEPRRDSVTGYWSLEVGLGRSYLSGSVQLLSPPIPAFVSKLL